MYRLEHNNAKTDPSNWYLCRFDPIYILLSNAFHSIRSMTCATILYTVSGETYTWRRWWYIFEPAPSKNHWIKRSNGFEPQNATQNQVRAKTHSLLGAQNVLHHVVCIFSRDDRDGRDDHFQWTEFVTTMRYSMRYLSVKRQFLYLYFWTAADQKPLLVEEPIDKWHASSKKLPVWLNPTRILNHPHTTVVGMRRILNDSRQ